MNRISLDIQEFHKIFTPSKLLKNCKDRPSIYNNSQKKDLSYIIKAQTSTYKNVKEFCNNVIRKDEFQDYPLIKNIGKVQI